MARLPHPGGDDGQWGDILNTYLSQAHNSDGTLKSNVVGASALKDGAVPTNALADGAVTEDKLSSDVQAKLNNTSGTIADGSITKAKLSSSVQDSLDKADSALQSAPVTSVAGKTGDVTLAKTDVGLGNVDDTSDADKPISDATQLALDDKASKTFVSDGYLPIKNGTSPITDSPNDFFARINISNDGSATASWPDRFAFYFDGNRTGYHNEYGELRARPGKKNTVPFRVMEFAGGTNTNVNLFEVAYGTTPNIPYFAVSNSASSLTVPLTSTEDITAPNLVMKQETWANTTDPVKREVQLTYPLTSTNPDTLEYRVTRGDGQANFRASWTNEWGALRGTSPYQGYGDALVRAIRTDQDIVGTGATATASNALELVDRRTGASAGVMWGRSWVDGHLTRNDIAMADSVLLGASDPVPAGLPAGTIIVRKS